MSIIKSGWDDAGHLTWTASPVVADFMRSDAKMRTIMGPVGCLAAGTLVMTEGGPLPIERIDRPMRVLSWNEKTGRFQLSWCGGSFPKGRDYLYHVSTQAGGFDASAHHRLLVYGGDYQQVEYLIPGQCGLRCSDALRATTALSAHKLSLEDADDLTQTSVGFLARYAELARRYGRLLREAEGSDLASAPLQDDARTSGQPYDGIVYAPEGDQMEPSQERNHQGLHGDQKRTGDYVLRFERLRAAWEDYSASLSCGRTEEKVQETQQFGQMIARRSRGEGFQECYGSYIESLSEGAIISITKKKVKEEYWDLQVLETHNYVTIDGSVHHNSGKSVACCFEVFRRASQQAPDNTGKRRTRCAVVRETSRQLQDTTIKTWLDWFPEGKCGYYRRTIKTYFLIVGDIECEVMFRALDDADDVANLNSLELTFAWFNECRDIHPDIVDAMSKRVGRFPSKKDGGPTWHGMWGDTNPPTIDTWWYYQMEHLDPKDGVSPNDNGWHVFKQPSGLSPGAENIENLPDGYYDTQGRSEEYIRTFIRGEYGLSLAGTPVYKYFRPDYHIARSPITPLPSGMRSIIVGMDLGLTPAAVIGQYDARGRLLILDEAVSYDMGIQRFTRTMLKPLLVERFPGYKIVVVVDPAGIQRAQTDERTAIDIIKNEGLTVIPANTNMVTKRLNAVDDFLMRAVDGDPGFLADPRCYKLKAAMMGGYRFHKTTGNIEKNAHSHVAEALQYLALHAAIQGGTEIDVRRPVQRVAHAGWT